ncbi:N-acetylated-alpha-linked acidic dipeptidase 2 isoform X1 [Nematostella vectensis]|uniref:N-acetylated-alpha-linked acidic dipeptidase 2 isoform X1 n=1 Tax=Nematostella vectensis TaxID=45351 RepID=UPI002077921B|nr:N-acetylated-alpha-linked acidic dipeptidase 2 isoform X1 [Nematostella vectensis]
MAWMLLRVCLVFALFQQGYSKKKDYMKELEEFLMARNMEENLRYLSKKPHVAGSRRNNELATEIARRWREYGFDKVEMPKYDMLLSLPDEKNLSTAAVIDGKGKIKIGFQHEEKPLTADERQAGPDMMPSFLSNPLTGTVSGDVVYVNHGMDSDFERLSKFGVSAKGHIVLIRMGKGYRGNKIKAASDNGAIGALVYTDPEEFAPEGSNQTFPDSWWLPETGVQRGAAGMGSGPGDARTPGYPSVDGIYRIPLTKLKKPKIPAYGLSYKDALQILKRMKGPKAPKDWQGKLPVTYRLGPGFRDASSKVQMTVTAKSVTKSIYNVIGTIAGREEPDRYVILGNHRDAWVFGASDPSSGTAILMELSRGLGNLLKKGWRPRRTIILCSWDAEEQFVSGSTEWVEEHAQVLGSRAVTYLNIDVGVGGNFTLNMDGSALIEKLLVETAKEVQDPTEGKRKASLYDVILERDARKVRGGVPFCENLAFGSDYVSFYHFLGIPGGDWAYIFGGRYGIRRSYPLYHSIHDNFDYIKKFVDPQFKIHLAVAKYTARVLLKVADAEILPFNVTNFAWTLEREMQALKALPALKSSYVSLKYLRKAVNAFYQTALKFDALKSAGAINGELAKRAINDQMMGIERAFIDSITPNQKLPFRNVLYGADSSNIYDGMYFPRVKEAVKRALKNGDWDKVRKEVSVLTFSVRSAREMILLIE